MQTAAKIQPGTVFHFGWKRTPNTVVRVSDDGKVAYLRGPRGAEYTAMVRPDGTLRKI